jgi:hypothetical protein
MLLNEADFKNHLSEQIDFLILSSQSFDNGFIAEAKRLAVIIRVLLHDTESSHSLLKLLNRKNMHFYDTSNRYNPRNLLPHWGLIKMEMKSGTDGYSIYKPMLDDVLPSQAKRKISFKNWWTKEIVLEDSNKKPFSRKDIVLGLANKDGGAHIDPNLNEKYANLTRENSTGWKYTDGTNESIIYGAELASMRQIAHEVLKTFKDEFPEQFLQRHS